MSFIEFQDVSFSWPGSARCAVDGLDLRIEEGEYIAVVGRNGSGKSTLLRLFDGLVRPDSGRVEVGGRDTKDPASLWRIRADCALVFQSPRDQLAASVVEEDAAFGPLNLGLSRAAAEARALAALEAVGLLEERRRRVHALSAGQQQRLAIAGALAMEPRCVAFDEATSMLDPPARFAVLELMDELVARGMAVVHVTHDMEEASRARRILVLERGKLVFDGSPAALFGFAESAAPASEGAGHPRALDLGLELPACQVVARALGLVALRGETPRELAARSAALLGPSRIATAPSAASVSKQARPDTAAVFKLGKAGYSYLRGTEAEVRALEDIDLELRGGTRLALVGKTGSGKSSLLQLLDALAKPSGGSVRSFGIDTSDKKADLGALRVRAPLSIQRPETALFETFAGDDVAFGPRNLGLSGEALVARVRTWMDAVGLPFAEFRDRQTRSLSGGEKRRLALAGVLAMESEALLLDEPTASLDPETRSSVRGLLADASARGLTLVIATHAMEEAADSDLVAVLARGRLLALGPPDRLFYEDFDPAWGIERPRAVEIAVAFVEQGFRIPGRPLDLPSLVAALASALPGAAASAEAAP